MPVPVVVVHGGAARVNVQQEALKLEGVKRACRAGRIALLKGTGSALDAVEAAVKVMEDDPAFNAGYGSSLTQDGEVEMDALIMEGVGMRCGAVAAVSKVRNPITLARLVMERSDHCLLVTEGAHIFAGECGLDIIDGKQLVSTGAQTRLKEHQTFSNAVTDSMGVKVGEKGSGCTVGAVAVDEDGNVASATSTGGITGKRKGRVGDTPVPGAGGWADNETAAISTTGHGEAIMRVSLSRHIVSLLEKHPLQDATARGLEYMRHRVNGFGGAIAVDSEANVGLYFTTEHMPWAYMRNDSTICYGVRPKEHETIAI